MKIHFRLTLSDEEYDRLLCDYIQAKGGGSLLGATHGADLDEILGRHLGEEHTIPLALDTETNKLSVPFFEEQT